MKTTKTTEVQARIVYSLETPRLMGRMYQVDRVIVEYVASSEEDEGEPSIDLTIKGWRLTSKMTVDKRQSERDSVYLTRTERAEFVKDDLGIDYEADLSELLGITVKA